MRKEKANFRVQQGAVGGGGCGKKVEKGKEC
jgi:hypothetical protein